MAYHGGTDNPLVANTGNPASLNIAYFSADPCMTEPDDGVSDRQFESTRDCGGDGARFAASRSTIPGTSTSRSTATPSSPTTRRSWRLRCGRPSTRSSTRATPSRSPPSPRRGWPTRISSTRPRSSPILRRVPVLGGPPGEVPDSTRTAASARRPWKTPARQLRIKDPACGASGRTKRVPLPPSTRPTSPLPTWPSRPARTRRRRPGETRSWATSAASRPTIPTVGNDSKVMKLGDIFRSSPVTVGTPSTDFRDLRDANHAFAAFRTANPRSSANEQTDRCRRDEPGPAPRVQDLRSAARSGASFRPTLSRGSGRSPTRRTRQTSSTSISSTGPSAWPTSGWGRATARRSPSPTGRRSSSSARAGGPTRFSGAPRRTARRASTTCTRLQTAISTTAGTTPWTSPTPSNPVYKWRITPTEAGAPYLGDPWSKIMIHRVKIDGNEKWVGFLGGGHQLSVCNGGDCDKRGKGFFVIDLSNGSVLWSYTRADDAAMDYAMPAPPTMVDADLDGFIDTAYIGDLGGNIWRFKFCSATDGSSCNTSNWTGSRLFERAGGHRGRLRGPGRGKGPERQSLALLGNGGQAGTDHRGGRRGPHLCREGHGECRDDQPARKRHLLELSRTRTKKKAGISSWPETARRCSRSRPSSAAWRTSRATSRAPGAMSASRGRGRPDSTPWDTSRPHRQRGRATGASRSGTASRRRPSYPSSPAGRGPPICT